MNTPAEPRDMPFIVILPRRYPTAAMRNTENIRNATEPIDMENPPMVIKSIVKTLLSKKIY